MKTEKTASLARLYQNPRLYAWVLAMLALLLHWGKGGNIMNDTVRIESGNTKMVAHRGLSGLERENTCAAFEAAGQRDYYGIETDVHVTADGQYVVIHDDRTGRVSPVDMPVEKSNFADLRSLELYDMAGTPSAQLRIPTLAEYLQICKKHGKVCVLELKNDFTREEVAQILAIVEENGCTENMVYISFSYQNMVYLRELAPHATLQFLCSCPVTGLLIKKLKAHRLDLDIHHIWLNKRAIALLHRHGIKVNAWTVNDPKRGQKLADWGIDFITTNILQ